MLRVDAKQGSPKDGNSPLELFQVISLYVNPFVHMFYIHLCANVFIFLFSYCEFS